MAPRTPPEPRSYVFVFQLGKGAKASKARSPSSFAAAPCYYYRQDHAKMAAPLLTIPEPAVDDDDVATAFGAIDAFIAGHDLKLDLYSDVEIAANSKRAESRGFHAAATLEEARAALAQGGFTVVDLGRPPGQARDVAELERHLGQTSLELILDGLKRKVPELPRHAEAAARIVTQALGAGRSEVFVDAVRKAVPGWHPALRDTLLLLAGRAADDDEGKRREALVAFVAALPPAEDAAVRRRLESWGLRGKGARAAVKAREAGASEPPGKSEVDPKVKRTESLLKKPRENFDRIMNATASLEPADAYRLRLALRELALTGVPSDRRETYFLSLALSAARVGAWEEALGHLATRGAVAYEGPHDWWLEVGRMALEGGAVDVAGKALSRARSLEGQVGRAVVAWKQRGEARAEAAEAEPSLIAEIARVEGQMDERSARSSPDHVKYLAELIVYRAALARVSGDEAGASAALAEARQKWGSEAAPVGAWGKAVGLE